MTELPAINHPHKYGTHERPDQVKETLHRVPMLFPRILHTQTLCFGSLMKGSSRPLIITFKVRETIQYQTDQFFFCELQ